MTGALLILQPVTPLTDAGPCIPQGSPAPEWHQLRLFGRGRHPVNFEAGRERIVDL